MGSYLARVRREGCVDVRVSFRIEREEAETIQVRLPPLAEARDGFVYVPAGTAVLGGDEGALDSEAFSERALPEFWIQRCEVTVAQYFEFLNDLDRSDPAHAEARGPREGIAGGSITPRWMRSPERQLVMGVRMRSPDCPILAVSCADAEAYCAWLAERDPDPRWEYGLPTEAEWEKAARGGDGRAFPWGDAFDATFASSKLSAWTSEPLPVGSFPTDESPWGVRDMAGSLREWCAARPGHPLRALRGGSWNVSTEELFHAANRSEERYPDFTDSASGFRVVRRLRR
jgi:serine/threonine-protein kinase